MDCCFGPTIWAGLNFWARIQPYPTAILPYFSSPLSCTVSLSTLLSLNLNSPSTQPQHRSQFTFIYLAVAAPPRHHHNWSGKFYHFILSLYLCNMCHLYATHSWKLSSSSSSSILTLNSNDKVCFWLKNFIFAWNIKKKRICLLYLKLLLAWIWNIRKLHEIPRWLFFIVSKLVLNFMFQLYIWNLFLCVVFCKWWFLNPIVNFLLWFGFFFVILRILRLWGFHCWKFL